MVGANGGRRGERRGVAVADTPPLEALDRVTDGFVALDRAWRMTYVNRPAGRMLGVEPEALVGRRLWDVYPGLAGTEFEARFREAMDTQEPVAFEEYYPQADRQVAVRVYPSETGLSVFARDVTEKRDRERAIREHEQRLLTVIESSTDAIMLKDREGRYRLVNQAAADVLDRPKGKILGRTDEELFGEAVGREIRERERRALETGRTMTYEEEIRTPSGVRIYETTRTPHRGPGGDLLGTVGVCRDITARKERERELRRYETLVETSPDPMFALDEELRVSLVNRAMEEFVGVDREAMLGETVGESVGSCIVGDERLAEGLATVRRMLAGETTAYEKRAVPMIAADDERVHAEFHLGSVAGDDGPSGVVGVVRDITEHREQQRQIRRQRDQLETLDRINSLVQWTIRGVVEAATREEIAEMVVERLAESDLYTLAWISERASADDGVVVRTASGVSVEEVEAVLAGYEGADATDPNLIAMETRELHLTPDLLADPDIPESVLDEVSADAARSGVIVPLRYDDVVYGTLGVVAPRPDAFSEHELAAFEVLGETVGFAIDATGNRRLLLGDAAAELEFRVSDQAAPLVALSAAVDGRCVLERAVPAGDDRLVHYVTVEGTDGSTVADHLSGVDGVGEVRLVREDEDGAFLAVTATGTVPARLVTSGATPRSFVASDGVGQVTVDVPPGVDVHGVVETLAASFPESTLVAKRYAERPHETSLESVGAIARQLTDRQWAALSAALAAGYYDWPRGSTAEEVADSMDISSATLHYHLRRAEGTIVRTLLDAAD